MKKISAVLSLLVAAALSYGDVPSRSENLIYTILSNNGKEYSPTFALQSSDSIYLIAGVDNFLSLRKTLVYWWPITSEWKLDTDSLNFPLTGVLELTTQSGRAFSLNPVRYTYFNVRGEYELNWRVAKGGEADAAWSHWMRLQQDYLDAVRKYQTQNALYERDQDALMARILKLKGNGQNVRSLMNEMSSMKKPESPQEPNEYAVPPAPIQEAFIVNLPRGEYRIRLRNPDGTIMEGSEKNVVVHERRRAGRIGYEVIPGDKWTRPEESYTPSSVLYVNGGSDLYLQPFFEDEFNDLLYNRTVRNDAQGNASLMRWVRIQQVPGAKLAVSKRGAPPSILLEQPFMVEQSQGNALGYRIVPHNPQTAHKGKEPSLIAFRIPVGGNRAYLRLVTLDASGQVLAGSTRQIRVVAPGSGAGLAAVLLAIIPILAGVVVLLVRSRRYFA